MPPARSRLYDADGIGLLRRTYGAGWEQDAVLNAVWCADMGEYSWQQLRYIAKAIGVLRIKPGTVDWENDDTQSPRRSEPKSAPSPTIMRRCLRCRREFPAQKGRFMCLTCAREAAEDRGMI